MHTQSTRKKMLRSRTFPSHIHPGVPRIFLAAPLSYAAIGLPHDHGEGFWATENSQPVKYEPVQNGPLLGRADDLRLLALHGGLPVEDISTFIR